MKNPFRLKIIDLYIIKEILVPFFITVLFWTALFITIVFKDVLGELIGKGIDFLKILEYLVYLIGDKITFTLPVASLFAGILAAGRLSSDSEITAMRASGISLKRIHTIYMVAGFAVMVFSGWIYFYLGPISSKARLDFEEWLKTYYSFSLVKPGRFLNMVDTESLGDFGQDIYARYRSGTVLKNIQIRKWKNSFENAGSIGSSIKSRMIQIIMAEKGELLTKIKEDGEKENFIRLQKGFMLEMNPNSTAIEITDFRNGYMDYVLPRIQKKVIKVDVKPENYTFPELIDFLEKLEKGEHRIDLFATDSGTGNVKLDSVFGGQKLPSYQEMVGFLNQKKIWLLQNYNSVGKDGGPTLQEYNEVAQTVFRLEIFLRDVERTKRKFEVEIQKRLALPVANFLFFFISFPLGLVAKRTGKGMSFALALVTFFFYYALLSLGIANSYEGRWNPVTGVWYPNFLMFLFGLYILSIRTDEIRFLESFATGIDTFYRKYVYSQGWYMSLESFLKKALSFLKK